MVTHVDVALVVGCQSSVVKKEGEGIFSKSLFCGSLSFRTSKILAKIPCRLDSFIQSYVEFRKKTQRLRESL